MRGRPKYKEGVAREDWPLNERQKKFALKFLECGNLGPAAIHAGYAPRYARHVGQVIYHQPNVAKFLRLAREKEERELRISTERVLQGLLEIAEADLADMLDEDGRLLPVPEWPPALRKSVRRARICGVFERTREGKRRRVEVLRIRFHSRVSANRLLGLSLRLFDGPPPPAPPTPEETAALTARIRAELFARMVELGYAVASPPPVPAPSPRLPEKRETPPELAPAGASVSFRPEDRPLSPRQRRFALKYLECHDATQAALFAGYSKKGAGDAGYGVRLQPNVAKFLRLELQKFEKPLRLTGNRILRNLLEIAEADIADMCDGNGKVLPIQDWPLAFRRTLAGLELVLSPQPAKGRRKIRGVRNPRFDNRLLALKLLGDHLGMFKKRKKGPRDSDGHFGLSPRQCSSRRSWK